MPRLITLHKMPSRSKRPRPSELEPWEPGKSARRILEYLYRYRYLTSELLAVVYQAEQGRGRYQVQHQLTKLWRYGLVERFYRPAEWGSSQYVYSLSVDGAHLVVPEGDWSEERTRIYNLASPKADYEHPLAISLIQLLWDLGAPSQSKLFNTLSVWQDREGSKAEPVNTFEAQVDGEKVSVQPDLTLMIGHLKRNYYRPYFFEVERTHKNYERLRRRFRAYGYLLGPAGERVVREAYKRELGLVPARGMAIFVGATKEHAEALRQTARAIIPPKTELWFTSLDHLLKLEARKRRDGQPCRGRDGEVLQVETPIAPEEFFSRDLLVNLNGKRGRLVV